MLLCFVQAEDSARNFAIHIGLLHNKIKTIETFRCEI